MPSGEKDFLCSRMENTHSANDVMDRILLKNGWRIKHFKYTGNGSPVFFDGFNLFVFHVKVNKVFCQGDIGEVHGWDAFVISPLGKGLPLRIIDVTGRITQRISRHVYNCIWEIMLFQDVPDNSHVARSRTDEAPCETGAVACWARTGKEPRRSAKCEDVV